jgi:hypothetical protein
VKNREFREDKVPTGEQLGAVDNTDDRRFAQCCVALVFKRVFARLHVDNTIVRIDVTKMETNGVEWFSLIILVNIHQLCLVVDPVVHSYRLIEKCVFNYLYVLRILHLKSG